ncbi:membrane protein, partial [Streptomyces sp. NRRL S-4]
MRSARTLFASAAVTAVLAVSVPAAYAMTSADDWEKDSGSSAGSNDHREKPDSWKHDKPEGGVHAGGGALAGVSADD